MASEPYLDITQISTVLSKNDRFFCVNVYWPIGDKCGHESICAAFKIWLDEAIGREKYSKIDPLDKIGRVSDLSKESGLMKELMEQFQAELRHFSNNTETVLFDLPRPLENLSIEGRFYLGALTLYPCGLFCLPCLSSHLTWYRNEMKEMFDGCVTKIISLISNQIKQSGYNFEEAERFKVGHLRTQRLKHESRQHRMCS